MKKRYFDIKRDMAIVKAGGFFCQACLEEKPTGEQSPDRRYCQSCYNFLQQDRKKAVEPSKDYYWEKDGTIFILEGQKYGVTKTGATVCLGGVATPPEGGKTPLEGQEAVSKYLLG